MCLIWKLKERNWGNSKKSSNPLFWCRTQLETKAEYYYARQSLLDSLADVRNSTLRCHTSTEYQIIFANEITKVLRVCQFYNVVNNVDRCNCNVGFSGYSFTKELLPIYLDEKDNKTENIATQHSWRSCKVKRMEVTIFWAVIMAGYEPVTAPSSGRVKIPNNFSIWQSLHTVYVGVSMLAQDDVLRQKRYDETRKKVETWETLRMFGILCFSRYDVFTSLALAGNNTMFCTFTRVW